MTFQRTLNPMRIVNRTLKSQCLWKMTSTVNRFTLCQSLRCRLQLEGWMTKFVCTWPAVTSVVAQWPPNSSIKANLASKLERSLLSKIKAIQVVSVWLILLSSMYVRGLRVYAQLEENTKFASSAPVWGRALSRHVTRCTYASVTSWKSTRYCFPSQALPPVLNT